MNGLLAIPEGCRNTPFYDIFSGLLGLLRAAGSGNRLEDGFETVIFFCGHGR
jgi:hypothetical protein